MQHKFNCLTKVTSGYPTMAVVVDKVLRSVALSVHVVVDDLPAWTLVSGLVVGSYANSILYILEVVTVIQYYSATKRKQDTRLFQAMVYFTFLVDTVSTISSYVTVYLVCNYYQLH